MESETAYPQSNTGNPFTQFSDAVPSLNPQQLFAQQMWMQQHQQQQQLFLYQQQQQLMAGTNSQRRRYPSSFSAVDMSSGRPKRVGRTLSSGNLVRRRSQRVVKWSPSTAAALGITDRDAIGNSEEEDRDGSVQEDGSEQAQAPATDLESEAVSISDSVEVVEDGENGAQNGLLPPIQQHNANRRLSGPVPRDPASHRHRRDEDRHGKGQSDVGSEGVGSDGDGWSANNSQTERSQQSADTTKDGSLKLERSPRFNPRQSNPNLFSGGDPRSGHFRPADSYDAIDDEAENSARDKEANTRPLSGDRRRQVIPSQQQWRGSPHQGDERTAEVAQIASTPEFQQVAGYQNRNSTTPTYINQPTLAQQFLASNSRSVLPRGNGQQQPQDPQTRRISMSGPPPLLSPQPMPATKPSEGSISPQPLTVCTETPHVSTQRQESDGSGLAVAAKRHWMSLKAVLKGNGSKGDKDPAHHRRRRRQSQQQGTEASDSTSQTSSLDQPPKSASMVSTNAAKAGQTYSHRERHSRPSSRSTQDSEGRSSSNLSSLTEILDAFNSSEGADARPSPAITGTSPRRQLDRASNNASDLLRTSTDSKGGRYDYTMGSLRDIIQSAERQQLRQSEMGTTAPRSISPTVNPDRKVGNRENEGALKGADGSSLHGKVVFADMLYGELSESIDAETRETAESRSDDTPADSLGRTRHADTDPFAAQLAVLARSGERDQRAVPAALIDAFDLGMPFLSATNSQRSVTASPKHLKHGSRSDLKSNDSDDSAMERSAEDVSGLGGNYLQSMNSWGDFESVPTTSTNTTTTATTNATAAAATTNTTAPAAPSTKVAAEAVHARAVPSGHETAHSSGWFSSLVEMFESKTSRNTDVALASRQKAAEEGGRRRQSTATLVPKEKSSAANTPQQADQLRLSDSHRSVSVENSSDRPLQEERAPPLRRRRERPEPDSVQRQPAWSTALCENDSAPPSSTKVNSASTTLQAANSSNRTLAQRAAARFAGGTSTSSQAHTSSH